MSNAERIYYHGRMSLAAMALVVATGLGAMWLWKPLIVVMIGLSLEAGYHIGSVGYYSLRDRRERRWHRMLWAVIDHPGLPAWQLSYTTGIGVASTYNTLHRMEDEGLVWSMWEEGPYPRKRLYYAAARATQARPAEQRG